ncbi:MAG: AAA family ATPase [Burkholderiales bacterium]|nr:AAA family ATPase [Burkholderiales bacterium]
MPGTGLDHLPDEQFAGVWRALSDAERGALAPDLRAACYARYRRISDPAAYSPDRGAPPPEGAAPSIWPAPLDLIALSERDPAPPSWIVPGWMLAGYATLLAGHGGSGKSQLALYLACAIAIGARWAGIDCAPRRVLYLSCEDREGVVHWRLSHIARHMGIGMIELAGRLAVLDLVGRDAILWSEDARTGYTVTPAYGALAERMREGYEVLVVDGITDTYGGHEIARGEVRRYVTALLGLVPADRGALLLIGHVNRPTAANGSSVEGYSGSTAWHNAVRGRWYLRPDRAADDVDPGTGRLLLEHQKSNLGRPQPAIAWRWDDDAHMFVAEPAATEFDRAHAEREELAGVRRALLACAGTGVGVPAAMTGPRTAYHVLRERQELPATLRSGRDAARRFWRSIERLRQMGHIGDGTIRRSNRHALVTIELTPEGRAACAG